MEGGIANTRINPLLGADSFSAGQELRYLNLCDCVQNSEPLNVVLCPMNPFHTHTYCSLNIHFNIILPPTLGNPKCSSLQFFWLKFLCMFHFSNACYIYLPSNPQFDNPNNISWIVQVITYLLTYLLTHSLHGAGYSLFFEKLIVTQLVKQYSDIFMEPKSSLPSLQKPATGPYSEPAESSSPHRSISP